MRALLSVANRDGIADMARDLRALDVDLFATDGTREYLVGEGVEVASVSDLTTGGATVGGQVKTFHHAVYAGILARRDVPAQLAELEAQGIGLIDLVIVNVKPFAPAIGVKLIGLDEAIEMIDVGGAALLGAAARNAAGVAAVADPAHYSRVTNEIREMGQVSPETRAQLAAEAFSTVAAYHAEIAAYLNQISGNTFPRRLAIVLEKVDDLRYGENPHQRAAFYRETTHRSGTLADATRIAGDLPSFNNLMDLDAAYRIARDYTSPTVAIVKHTDPVGPRLARRARRGVPACPRDGSGRLVRRHRRREPGDGRRPRPARSRRIRTRRSSPRPTASPRLGILRAKHGLRDPGGPARSRPRACATTASPTWTSSASPAASSSRASTNSAWTADACRSSPSAGPTLEELTDLLFAWRAVRHVRSNAIVLARNGATVGIGAAQASRQVSVEIALRRAGDRAKLSVMASDAYFPFPDGISAAANAGITAIIQPGGSIRDEMAIEVADRHHLAMVFTGRRHFRH